MALGKPTDVEDVTIVSGGSLTYKWKPAVQWEGDVKFLPLNSRNKVGLTGYIGYTQLAATREEAEDRVKLLIERTRIQRNEQHERDIIAYMQRDDPFFQGGGQQCIAKLQWQCKLEPTVEVRFSPKCGAQVLRVSSATQLPSLRLTSAALSAFREYAISVFPELVGRPKRRKDPDDAVETGYSFVKKSATRERVFARYRTISGFRKIHSELARPWDQAAVDKATANVIAFLRQEHYAYDATGELTLASRDGLDIFGAGGHEQEGDETGEEDFAVEETADGDTMGV